MSRSLFDDCGVLYVDHIAVTTPTFERTLNDFLGLRGTRLVRGPGLNVTQRVSYAFVKLADGMTVEILGARADSPIQRHVDSGGGPYHFCFAVADLQKSIAAAVSGGARVVVDPVPDVAFDGRRVAFLFHESQGLFEFVEALPSGHEVESSPETKVPTQPGVATQSRYDAPAADLQNLDDRLTGIFAGNFPGIEKSRVATAMLDETTGWDSLAQLRLMMDVERAFGIEISADEIGELTSFERIRWAVEKKLQ